MTFKKQIFIPNKRDYISGKARPKVDCIICSFLKKDSGVVDLTVWNNGIVGACLNLYPYNAGHLLLYPMRHITDPREFSNEETEHMHALLVGAMNRLDELYAPAGYNIGFNVGYASGASIQHVHQHLVPRYKRELGFIDVAAGAKIIIEDPNVTLSRVRKAFADFSI